MTAPGLRNYLRALGADPAGNGPADADLIARVEATRDESAFELLVWWHAPLVHAVCRAVLRDHHAAEGAAQATFLVLAKKAATFANRGSVVGWLSRRGVALGAVALPVAAGNFVRSTAQAATAFATTCTRPTGLALRPDPRPERSQP